GQYYQARNGVLRPRGPSRSGPPILIGAKRPRMLRVVAQYANAWNTAWHADPTKVKERYEQLLEACAEVGRDPATIELTVGTVVNLRQPGEEEWLGNAISGSPEEIANTLRSFADVGVAHLIVMIDPPGIAGIERFSRIVELLRQG